MVEGVVATLELPVENEVHVNDAVVDALLDPVRVCVDDAEEVRADATVLLIVEDALVPAVEV